MGKYESDWHLTRTKSDGLPTKEPNNPDINDIPTFSTDVTYPFYYSIFENKYLYSPILVVP